MNIKFTFSPRPDLDQTPKDSIFTSSFEIPPEALQLADTKERVMAVAQAVGQLTQGSLFLSCKELGFKNIPIKQREENPYLLRPIFALTIVFRTYGFSTRTRSLKIIMPVDFPMPLWKRQGEMLYSVVQPDTINNNPAYRAYMESIQKVSENCLVLLNSYNKFHWEILGFRPRKPDNSIMTQLNKRVRKAAAEQRKKERLEQKRLKAQSENLPVEDGKATKRGRAVPGIFQGVQMRSQFEIRLAAELEKRNIRWKYEPERLGESNYLVDFYLPDYKCWIEVKGSFEPRDEFLLPEIAKMLERERSENLYVYTASNIFYVKNGQFKAMIKEDFWKLFTG